MGWRRGDENVQVNVVRGSGVGVVDDDVHDLRCGVLGVAEVDGDVLLTADGVLGEITQLLKWRREGIVSHRAFASSKGQLLVKVCLKFHEHWELLHPRTALYPNIPLCIYILRFSPLSSIIGGLLRVRIPKKSEAG